MRTRPKPVTRYEWLLSLTHPDMDCTHVKVALDYDKVTPMRARALYLSANVVSLLPSGGVGHSLRHSGEEIRLEVWTRYSPNRFRHFVAYVASAISPGVRSGEAWWTIDRAATKHGHAIGWWDVPAIKREWLSSNVKAIATAPNVQLSDAPILADALQDAGCNNEAILNPLRDDEYQKYRGDVLRHVALAAKR